MNQSHIAFAKRVTYGVVAGLFIVWGLATIKPTSQADVEVAKINAQSKLDVLAAQQAAKDKEASTLPTQYEKQERKLRCVLDLRNMMSRDYVDSHVQAFSDLITQTCG